MKKQIYQVIILIVLLGLFASCGNIPINSSDVFDSIDTPDDHSSKSAASTSGEPVSSGILQFRSLTYGDGNDKGFYMVAPRISEGIGVNNITYIDYQTQKHIVLCNRPECVHNDETCTGYITSDFNQPYISTWRESVVLIYPGNSYIADKGTEALPRVETISQDGSNRKTVLAMGANEQLELTFGLDDSAIYYSKLRVSGGEQMALKGERMLQKLDLTTGVETTLLSFESSYNYMTIVGAVKEELIMISIDIPQNTLPGDVGAMGRWTLFGVNRNTGERTDYKSWNQDELAGRVCDEQYVYVNEKQEICSYDFISRSETVLAENFSAQPTECTLVGYQNNKLMITVNKVLLNEEGTSVGFSEKAYTINLLSGSVDELTIALEQRDMQRPIPILASTKDHFLVIQKYEMSLETVYDDNQIPQSTEIEKPIYALISQTNYFDNQAEFLTINDLL